MKEYSLQIGGMHCVMCAHAVERALNKVPGVKATVSYAGETAAVQAEDKVTLAQLKKAVKKAGYSVMEDPEAFHKKEQRVVLITFLCCAVLSLPFFLCMLLMVTGLFPKLMQVVGNGWLQFVLATLIQFGAGWRFFAGAFASLKNRSANMDVLVSAGTLSAYAYSVYALFSDQRPLYFEASAMVITLVLLGKLFESRAKNKAGDAVRSLLQLQPKFACVLQDGKEVSLPTAQIEPGFTIVVRPGERVAVDGVIAQGESELEESMLTGESVPVHKQPGDNVYAGTVNRLGTFTFTATQTGRDTVLSGIVQMVTKAQQTRIPIQKTVDKVANIFVPTVISIAVVTFLITLLVTKAVPQALAHAVAVLVIACPCSLGLATPTAVMVGAGIAADHGILIRDAAALETAGKVRKIALDKTGTITKGTPAVTDVQTLVGTQEELLLLAACAEQATEHPVGKAIYMYVQQLYGEEPLREQLDRYALTDFRALPGYGVEGKRMRDGSLQTVYVGRPRQGQTALPTDFEQQGKTAVGVYADNTLYGCIAVMDEVKPEAKTAIEKLQQMQITPVMLTGDNEAAARAVADEVGITQVHARILPGEKQTHIAALKADGSVVAMVGDGANDAPALAAADVSIAMGTGTDIAAGASSLLIMSGSLDDCVKALTLSKKIMRKIRQNLFWAFIYNSIGLPLAAFGVLSPVIAGACMAFSSVSVVTNSLLLRREKLN